MRFLTSSVIVLIVLGVLTVTPLMAVDEQGSAFAPSEEGRVTELHRSPLTPARFDTSGHATEFRMTRDSPLNPATDAFVIVDPRVGFSPDEARDIRIFLETGGQVVLTASTAASQELLKRLNVGMSTTGIRVYTPAFNETPDRIVALNVGNLPGLPDEVIIQRGVAIDGGRPILRTAALSWADLNDNGRPDLDEPLRAATLAAYADVGKGRIYVIGDARIFHTQAAVADAFFDAAASGGRRIVFDEGHRPFSDPFTTNRLLAGHVTPLGATVITIIILVAVAVATLAPRLQAAPAKPRLSRSALMDDRLAEALAELEP